MKTSLFQTAALSLALVATGVNAYHTAPAIAAISKAKNLKNTDAEAAVIDRLEYDFAKATIRDDYYQDLDQLASTIVNEKYAISLRGHADSIGNYVANWKLSDKRALEVKEYLVQKGVDEKRIVTTPYGSTEPIATNKTPEGRQKNRRVEVKLRKLNE
ncbi:OmpA family protein [Adhaeribacter pallidiroseus]|uniref:Outer membrane lipoprotein Omp16 like protein n=1 Tax=Adhaeribacter pallidiroseus TaxID=2072847 RepID=A0A369QNR4_9BACT|nr:OmpA family protein [Adhaeribacter pallidiroseus]RDC66521.1 Outer membrane lipoprotein Omp16 like protein [Adhaeribacter pallidiroseus]